MSITSVIFICTIVAIVVAVVVGFVVYSKMRHRVDYMLDALEDKEFNFRFNEQVLIGRDFNKTLSAIADEVKNGKFPKEIKHIMIGHGSGNVATKNWVTSEGSVLKYINTNNNMEKGDLVLVACCEDGLGAWSPDFPGRGLPVELVPCDRFKNDAGRGPAKIVRRGEEIICGDYSLTNGLKIYDN